MQEQQEQQEQREQRGGKNKPGFAKKPNKFYQAKNRPEPTTKLTAPSCGFLKILQMPLLSVGSQQKSKSNGCAKSQLPHSFLGTEGTLGQVHETWTCEAHMLQTGRFQKIGSKML